MEGQPIKVLLISEDTTLIRLVEKQFANMTPAGSFLTSYALLKSGPADLIGQTADQLIEVILLDLCGVEMGMRQRKSTGTLLGTAAGLPVVAICEEEKQISKLRKAGVYQQFLLKDHIQSYLLEQVLQGAIARRDSEELLRSKNRAEDDLHNTNHMLRALVQSAQLGIIAIDRQKKITLWNPAAEKIFGWKAEEVLGGPLPHLPEYLKAGVDLGLDEEFKGTLTEEFEAVRQKKDGSLIVIRASSAPLYNANHQIIGSMGIFSDQTEHKETEKVIRRQTEELSVLNSIALKASQSLNLKGLLPMVCVNIARIPGYHRVVIWLIDEKSTEIKLEAYVGVAPDELAKTMSSDAVIGATGHVIRTGEPMSGDYSNDLRIPRKLAADWRGWHDYAVLPIRVNEKILGTINIASHERGVITKDDLEVLDTFANQIGIAIQNARLFEQVSKLLEEVQTGQDRLQALSRRLVDVQELERRKIARELHDEIGQILTGLKLLLELSSQLPPELNKANLKEAQSLLSDLIIKVRNLSLELRPAMLDDLGLLPALLWHFDRFTSQTHVQVNFEHSGIKEQRFSSEIETAAYRIIQEALTNVTRYAGVNEVKVSITSNAASLKVEVIDQGSGFDYDNALKLNQGNGLSGMSERAVLLGGSFSLESNSGKGTHLTAYLPLGGSLEQEQA